MVNIKVITVQSEFAVIRWDKFNTSDERQLLSWIVNYREASVVHAFMIPFLRFHIIFRSTPPSRPILYIA